MQQEKRGDNAHIAHVYTRNVPLAGRCTLPESACGPWKQPGKSSKSIPCVWTRVKFSKGKASRCHLPGPWTPVRCTKYHWSMRSCTRIYLQCCTKYTIHWQIIGLSLWWLNACCTLNKFRFSVWDRPSPHQRVFWGGCEMALVEINAIHHPRWWVFMYWDFSWMIRHWLLSHVEMLNMVSFLAIQWTWCTIHALRGHSTPQFKDNKFCA